MRKILHIYHGNGKGKTTSAIGLAIRAVGAGLKVCFVQFLKNGSSSETDILKYVGIEYICCETCNKFVFQMNESEKVSLKSEYDKILQQVFSSDANIIVLDEFLDVYNLDMIDKSSADCILNTEKEVILTGRNPAEIFINNADYISEINSIRHPYEKGVPARKGIEF